jgi:hypothetical protein
MCTFTGWASPRQIDRLNDLRLKEHYKEARLYGAKRLSFVYFHYGVPAGPTAPEPVAAKVIESWRVSPQSGDPDLRRTIGEETLDQLKKNMDILAGIPAYSDSSSISEVLNDKCCELNACRADYRKALAAITGLPETDPDLERRAFTAAITND